MSTDPSSTKGGDAPPSLPKIGTASGLSADRQRAEMLATAEIVECVTVLAGFTKPWLVRYEDGTLAVMKRVRAPEVRLADMTLMHHEVAAFLLSDALGLGLVPPTTLRQMPTSSGGTDLVSIQLYVEGDDDASLEVLPEERVRQGAAFDHVIGQQDRLEHNWRIVQRPEGPDIVLYDNGAAFNWQPEGLDLDPDVARSALLEAAERLGGPDFSICMALEEANLDFLAGLLTEAELAWLRVRIDEAAAA